MDAAFDYCRKIVVDMDFNKTYFKGKLSIRRADSCIKLDVCLVLRTTDGALIVMTYQCLRAGPPAVIEKLDRGEEVDPATYYFRMSPMFETSAPKYDWMNRIIAIGAGYRRADGPIYGIFEVL
jgi:Protein of unknown function (DUF3237)